VEPLGAPSMMPYRTVHVMKPDLDAGSFNKEDNVFIVCVQY
jgi:hypothetical protein